MELNWSTFILESINFLVLVWILKRLLYRPILNAVQERKKKIQENLQQAQKLRQEATELQEKYRGRLQEWEKEKEAKRKAFKKEIEVEKANQENIMKRSLEKQKEKSQAIEERRLSEQTRKNQEEALAYGAKFASSLLKPLAGPEMEKRILDLFLKEMTHLPTEKLQILKNGLMSGAEKVVEIRSAFPLEASQKEKLQNALRELFKDNIGFQFLQDSELVAGLSVNLGPIILEANLRDELSFFTEAAQHGE